MMMMISKKTILMIIKSTSLSNVMIDSKSYNRKAGET